jgi:hypothetical protein
VKYEENQLEVYIVVLDFLLEVYLIDIIHNHLHKYSYLDEYNEYVLHYLEDERVFFFILFIQVILFSDFLNKNIVVNIIISRINNKIIIVIQIFGFL